MKQLNKFQNILFQVGGILLVVGAILPMVPELNSHAATIFAIGALLFGSMQMLQRYEGDNFVIKRLRRQQLLGAILLMVTACLMIMKRYQLGPFSADEWKIVLIVAVILELYTSFRIPHELEKEEKKNV